MDEDCCLKVVGVCVDGVFEDECGVSGEDGGCVLD